MKPCSGDIRHKVLITGDELRELKRHTGSMAEAFGLDRKIEAYQGTRPITLYRWDLECLMDVIDCELGDPRQDVGCLYFVIDKKGRVRWTMDCH